MHRRQQAINSIFLRQDFQAIVLVDEPTNSYDKFWRIFAPGFVVNTHDSSNNIFAIQASDYETIHLNIFDQWGNQVYAASGPNCQWNGLVDSNHAESRVYLYQFILKGPQGKTRQMTGTVTLIR